MLLIAFLAQSAAIGLTYGSVGLLIEPLARDLGASRSMVSLSIALIAVVSGLLGPTIGGLLDRWSLRGTMFIGCLVGAAGFAIAARAGSVLTFLFGCGVLAGVAFTMMGVLPANKIVNLWFPRRLGWASGIANLPLVNALVPPLFSFILVAHGWRTLLDIFAGIFLVVLCLVLLVRAPIAAPPPAVDDDADAKPDIDVGGAQVSERPRQPYQMPVFWVICLATGLLNTSGIAAITHLVAYAQDHGTPATQASVLLSVFGFCAAAGALFYGWLSDRLTPVQAIVINALLQVVLWAGIIAVPTYPGLLLLVGALGLCTGGVTPVSMTLLGRVFGSRQFGTALGQLMMAVIPFNFGAAPLAGYLYDRMGNYRGAFALEALLCLVAATGLWWYRRVLKNF
jgi:predicted MFS family arabinose efflux permease